MPEEYVTLSVCKQLLDTQLSEKLSFLSHSMCSLNLNIFFKLTSWKHKEKVVYTARKLKPEKVKFLNDFCKRTLEKRAAQRDRLLEERKKGNGAYFVGSHLVVYKKSNDDRPPGGRPPLANDNASQEGDGEIFLKG